jgi:hypothetical protein
MSPMVGWISGGTNAGGGVRASGGSDGILSPPKRAASWLPTSVGVERLSVGGDCADLVISFDVFFERRLRFGTASMTARSR